MTDQAPAYAQALDQLRAERDAAVARANAIEKQWAAIAQTPDGGWHVAYERAAAQLAAVTAERDELRIGKGYWQSVAEGVRAELHDAKCRIVDLEASSTPTAPTDLEERTGPVAFEHNQLRDENVRLRDENATLAAELDGTRSRLTMTTRDLDQSERAVSVLSTIIRASIEAIARGVK